ncbi:hypothetical protein SAMN05421578_103498 [Paenibacillus macquariensis]|uniref:Uncharacterized protein n=1 Tax=Paenibacillus macquariensis TaxID=948756 RepID=A0ABY1JU08_9BACL|nr:hypothetical protein SAMN05421578_103498 [Paenibacillus macquariensis]
MKVPQVVHIMSKYVDELADFCGNYHFLIGFIYNKT